MEYFKPAGAFKLLNRKKTDPNSFVFTGSQSDEGVDIQLFVYNKDNFSEFESVKADEVGYFDDRDKYYWLNIYGLSDSETIVKICQKLNIHHLVIQDILDVNQRPKFQEFEEFSFVTIKSTVPASADMSTEQISFVFGKNYLVSFQEKRSDHFGHLRVRLRENKGILRQRGPDYLLFTMLESILDNYFRTLQLLDKESEMLGMQNPEKSLSTALLFEIEKTKKIVHIIRKAIQPIKDFSIVAGREGLHFVENRHKKYFDEIKDLSLTLLNNCDFIAASLESSTNLFFSIQNQRMNQVMKTLTIVATIFIPLTFIAGVYGMNFAHMPELTWKFGYPAIWLVMIMVALVMLYFFRKNRWL